MRENESWEGRGRRTKTREREGTLKVRTQSRTRLGFKKQEEERTSRRSYFFLSSCLPAFFSFCIPSSKCGCSVSSSQVSWKTLQQHTCSSQNQPGSRTVLFSWSTTTLRVKEGRNTNRLIWVTNWMGCRFFPPSILDLLLMTKLVLFKKTPYNLLTILDESWSWCRREKVLSWQEKLIKEKAEVDCETTFSRCLSLQLLWFCSPRVSLDHEFVRCLSDSFSVESPSFLVCLFFWCRCCIGTTADSAAATAPSPEARETCKGRTSRK